MQHGRIGGGEMSDESMALTALVAVHRERDVRALLPVLLGGLEPVCGRVVACCYLRDEGGTFRLELLHDPSGQITFPAWRDVLGAPVALPPEAVRVIDGLAASPEPVRVASGKLPPLFDELWGAETAEKVRWTLPMQVCAVSAVVAGGQPRGLLLLFGLDGWTEALAAGVAAHGAAALGNVIERAGGQSAAEMFMRSVIEQVAARELDRAGRYGRVMSLAVVELPEERPTAARQVAAAALVTRIMRQPDTAGHLDGRRMVVVLPETPAAGAAVFLHRLYKQAGPELGSLRGASAAFPEDGHGWRDLLDTALARLDEFEPEDAPADPAAVIPTPLVPRDAASMVEPAAGGPLVSVRLRISPLAEIDVPGWQALVQRLPAVTSARIDGFDGLSAIVEIETPSVSRLLAQLNHLAGKIEASLNPTITGEIGLALRTGRRRMQMAS